MRSQLPIRFLARRNCQHCFRVVRTSRRGCSNQKHLRAGLGECLVKKVPLEHRQGLARRRSHWHLSVARHAFQDRRCGIWTRPRSQQSIRASHERGVAWSYLLAFASLWEMLCRHGCPRYAHARVMAAHRIGPPTESSCPF